MDKTSPTHSFINRQALVILSADGRRSEAEWLGWYMESFNEGCDWADTGWKNIGHMYDPETGMGLKGWPSAPQMVREYWDLAALSYREGQASRSAFYLGAAAHMVQDLCVPHHAAARVFDGHKPFEEYARESRHLFAVHDDGAYDLARTPEGWVIQNADYTRAHYSHCLKRDLERSVIHGAVVDLLPRAQRTTAGFVSFFLTNMGVA